MIFDFTFSLAVFRNPFVANSLPEPESSAQVRPDPNVRPRPMLRPDVPTHPADKLSQPHAHKRRRGWQPVEPQNTPPTLTPSVSAGLLNSCPTASSDHPSEQEDEEDRDCPPTKRRRTMFTDTLLTSALNVALISTAFGITAYRLWKGTPEEPITDDSPPPYEQGDWMNPSLPKHALSSSSPSSQKEAPCASSRKRGRQLRTHVAPRRRPAFIAPPRSISTHGHNNLDPSNDPSAFPSGDPETESGGMDDQMDWMSSQLRHLIAEGQKALGKEIVISADTAGAEDDDLVDDGDQGWNDEVEGQSSWMAHSTSSGRSSPRKSRRTSPSKRTQHPDCTFATTSASTPMSRSSQSRARHGQSQSFSQASSYDPRPSTPSAALDGLYQPNRNVQPTREGSPDLQLAMQRVRQAYGLNP